MAEALLGIFTLDDEIARFAPEDNAAGRRAEILLKTDALRLVLVTMRAGAELHEHAAPGAITIHTLRGELRVTVEGAPQELPAGRLIALAPGVRHAVQAQTDGAFLLTIATHAT